jgi:hypothetical protein
VFDTSKWADCGTVRRLWQAGIELKGRSGSCQYFRCNILAILFCQLTSIIIHDDGHAVHAKTVGFGHHSLAKPVRDVIGTQEASHDDGYVKWNDSKYNGEPPFKDRSLEIEISVLAAGKDAPRIACLTDGRFDERTEVPTASETVLYAQTTCVAKVTGPLGVNLAFEVKCTPTISQVSGYDEQGETYPKKESVNCEEGAVVEEDAGPTDERGDYTEGSGEGRKDEFRSISNAYNIGVGPCIEPGQETENDGNEGID